MMLVLLRQNFDDVFLGSGDFNFFQFSALPGEMIQFD